MPLPDPDTSTGQSFGLELDGVQVARIAEVSGLTMEKDVIEIKENTPDGKLVVRKLPGMWKSGRVTLKRGITTDRTFETWMNEATGTSTTGRSVSIVMYDEIGSVVKRFQLSEAWPVRLEAGTLDGCGTDIPMETLDLVYDRLEVSD